jgi:S-adenosylmethionine:tRNA ribosyltransferase-isomerase
MLVSNFDYDLPPELIAQEPLRKRDQSKMMILERKTCRIFHSSFLDFPDLLSCRDVLVINETRVFPARVWGKVDGKVVEFLFLTETEKNVWEVLCRPAKKVKPGETINFPQGLSGKVLKTGLEGRRYIQFDNPYVKKILNRIGAAPLPPYIKRSEQGGPQRKSDLERYQTVYARKGTSIAAPTAGLHFTPAVMNKLRSKGVLVIPITLEVGLATFQPVRVDVLEKHKMLKEFYTMPPSASTQIKNSKKDSRPVTAVGTTTVRALESSFDKGKIKPGTYVTDLFIYPGYTFKVVDKLLTNFHLPKSTLLMLVSAFAGTEFIKKAYAEAVKQKYRFFSYGDCMFIQ